MIDDVMDLAIPERKVYSSTAYTPDENIAGKRKFRKFNADDENYEKTASVAHYATIHPLVSWDFNGDKPDGPRYRISCICGTYTKDGSPDALLANFTAEHAFQKKKFPIPSEESFCDEIDAHLVTSYVTTVDGVRYHAPAIDVDLPVSIRESSPGKFHLFIDTLIPEGDYMDLLQNMAKARIVEPGYAAASKARHQSPIRLPDIPKVQNPYSDEPYKEALAKRKDQIKDPLSGLRDLVQEMAK